MYLQNSAASPESLRVVDRVAEARAEATNETPKPSLMLRIGVGLLLTSGAILGIINLVVAIHLIAVLLGG